MNSAHRARLESARGRSSDLENHVIDEFIAGRITRRDFVRRGTVIGMSLPLLGAIVTACGGGSSSPSGSAPAVKKRGGTIRCAIITPTGAVDPVTVGDTGGAVMLQQTGEYLSISSGDLI